MKIVVLDGFTENPGDLSWNGFEELGQLTVYDRTIKEQITDRIGDAQIVYTNKTPITREVLDACPQIRFIGVLATGYDVVDVAAAREKGIPVANIPTYGTSAVAQFTMALLLEICHHIGDHSRAVHDGQWSSSPDFCFWNHPLIELAGKTFGCLGFGRIGQATAAIAKAFGMRVIYYDAQPKPELEQQGFVCVSQEELFRQADVVSLHCPLFPSTEGIICRDTIANMKDGAILINTSRGKLIVEQDLADALNSGKIAAAGVDVVSTEPIKPDNPLLTAKNCFITPHIAWAAKESRQRLMDIAVDNLRQFLLGSPVNIVS